MKIAWSRLKWSAFAGNWDDDTDRLLWVRVWWQGIIVLSSKWCCFKIIEWRRVGRSWKLSIVDENRVELNWNRGDWAGFRRELSWEWEIDAGERGESYFRYGKHNLGLEIEAISGFCVPLLWEARKIKGKLCDGLRIDLALSDLGSLRRKLTKI